MECCKMKPLIDNLTMDQMVKIADENKDWAHVKQAIFSTVAIAGVVTIDSNMI